MRGRFGCCGNSCLIVRRLRTFCDAANESEGKEDQARDEVRGLVSWTGVEGLCGRRRYPEHRWSTQVFYPLHPPAPQEQAGE